MFVLGNARRLRACREVGLRCLCLVSGVFALGYSLLSLPYSLFAVLVVGLRGFFVGGGCIDRRSEIRAAWIGGRRGRGSA